MTFPTSQNLQLDEKIADSVAGLALGDAIVAAIRQALSEDLGTGDVTTNSTLSQISSYPYFRLD